jgi:hypothetical protein
MGTPHVNCISKLPTAHEPSGERLGNRERSDDRDRMSCVTPDRGDVTPRDRVASCQ